MTIRPIKTERDYQKALKPEKHMGSSLEFAIVVGALREPDRVVVFDLIAG